MINAELVPGLPGISEGITIQMTRSDAHHVVSELRQLVLTSKAEFGMPSVEKLLEELRACLER